MFFLNSDASDATMPGVLPGKNQIRLVLPFPKIQRTRESDTRSQSYGCLKFFLTVELWKFITNCTKTQINWNLCQFCVFFNALHAGVITFSVWSLYQSRLANLLAEVKFDVLVHCTIPFFFPTTLKNRN